MRLFSHISLVFWMACAIALGPVASQPAALAQPAADRVVVHGRIPSDADYWKFNKWYLNHSVLDVYVNGSEPNHLAKVLLEIEKLAKRSVLIRDIVVIGGLNFAQLDASTRDSISGREVNSEARDALHAVGIDPNILPIAKRLSISEGADLAKIQLTLKNKNIRQSPTWIISSRGTQYTYEGVPSVVKQFSRKGVFRGAEQTSPHTIIKSAPLLLPKVEKGPLSSVIPAYRYRLGVRRMPPGIGTYDVKPACSKPARRRKPVYFDTDELSDFDMTFYDYKIKSEKDRARKNATPTVPYLEGDLYNPHREKSNLQQGFGRFFDVRCLPTRVHYIYIGENRVEEYLEGELAWGVRSE